MATFNIANMGVTSNSISVRAYYGGTASERNALTCQFYCDSSYFDRDTHAGSKNWTTTTVTKTGLAPNTLYSFYAIFYNSGYNEIGRTQTINIRTDSVGEPTPLPPSSVTVSSITSSSVTVSHGTVSGANAYMLYREYNGMDIHIDTHTHPSSIFYVTGLMANTTYRMGVSSVNTSGESSIRWSSYFTTLSIVSERPDDWVWGSRYNIYSGGAFFRQSNKTAYLMDASHWNGFTVRINEFRRYKGVTDYVFTPVSSEMNVTATIINQAINAINDMLPSGKMANIPAGTIVAASIFINMKDKLNSIT